jgi:polysaccharide export outer membrane protein
MTERLLQSLAGNLPQLRRGARLVASAALLPLALAACNVLPNNGPLANEIVQASANKAQTKRPKHDVVFDVVDIDPDVAALVSSYRAESFNRTFGLGNGSVNPTVGVGDVLQITIFEAGPDGLFSTQDHKTTSVTVTVQPDGRAPVPYIGSLQFAGNSMETIRAKIVDALKTRAVEPDVIVTMAENASRSVAVNGVVGKPSMVSLGLSGERVTEVIAKAGGPTQAPYDTFVTLTRGGKTGKALLQTLIDEPKENIFARPGDQLFLTHDPQTFSVLGTTGKSAKIPMGAAQLSVIEAAALAGGANMTTANPQGFFIFRFEYPEVLKKVLGPQRFQDLLARGIQPNAQGMYPIVYRIDMLKPQAYLTGQSFMIRNKDVLYLSRHPATDITRFLTAVSQFVSIVRIGTAF